MILIFVCCFVTFSIKICFLLATKLDLPVILDGQFF
jgi:hypothetical protein